MSDISIAIEGLGKKYSIRHAPGAMRQGSLAEVLASGWRSFLPRIGSAAAPSDEELWVLCDIYAEIKRGEVVGIIGRNGAGKSTLLKILSGITDPSRGRAVIAGRVASLLEIGTGFHPELTGRENVFLNGAVLGMPRDEIRRKFDEIVAFSGVEKFLDTPVKRYSSGMYVRLAFAVASHLEPDILIVDEVLAVGDMDFQKKCLGRMDEVSRQGRTVLFVSHNLPMISSLCDQCMLLDAGRLVSKGPTSDVLPLYHRASFTSPPRVSVHADAKATRSKVELVSASVAKQDGVVSDQFTLFEDVFLRVAYRVTEDLSEAVVPFFHVLNEKGEYVFLTFPHDWPAEQGRSAGTYEAVCRIPAHLLNDGSYSVTVQVNTVASGHTLQFFENHALRFVIVDNIHDNPHRAHVKYSYQLPGSVRPLLDWQLVAADRQARRNA
jgi:lipopolysaccharide transport system ATP-binding protein